MGHAGGGPREEAAATGPCRHRTTLDDHLAPFRDRHPVAISTEVQEIDAEFRINRNQVRVAMEERA